TPTEIQPRSGPIESHQKVKLNSEGSNEIKPLYQMLHRGRTEVSRVDRTFASVGLLGFLRDYRRTERLIHSETDPADAKGRRMHSKVHRNRATHANNAVIYALA
ncbi:MAG: hypothetical protein AAFN27_23770, partial [Pseudomonadota bacterium]